MPICRAKGGSDCGAYGAYGSTLPSPIVIGLDVGYGLDPDTPMGDGVCGVCAAKPGALLLPLLLRINAAARLGLAWMGVIGYA